MENTKQYKIVINGIEESISQVDKLISYIKELETRINEISTKSINITSTQNPAPVSTTSVGTKSSALSEEEKLQKQIVQLEEKRIAYQSELYQQMLENKQLLKETTNEQKHLVAESRLQANEYANTISGMKQELSDIKSAMQDVDLGDGEQLKKMTERANELNSKLLEVEKSYGQFGRNVGNYPDVSEGINNIVIAVGGVERQFASAREASRELSNELKSMAVNGKQDTQEFKELQKTVAQLNSSIKDATVSSEGMDKLLDTMQSITALGSASQGFSTFFGFDDSEIQNSIQKLVALQNALKGIESINQQLKSGEFMGGYLQKANATIDAFVAKLTGANKAQQALTVSTNAGAASSKALAAAQGAQTVATVGTTVATKALSLALKSVGIGLIIAAVAALIEYWNDIKKAFTDTIPVLKNLGTWFDKVRSIIVGVGTALLKNIVGPFQLIGKIIAAVVRGDFANIPKIIMESLKDSYDVIGNFQKGRNKEIQRQQDEHNKKMRQQQLKANDEAEKDAEAKYGQDLNRTKEHYKKQLALVKKGSDEEKEYQRKIWELERRQKEENNRKSLTAAQKHAKEESDAEKELTELKIANMKEGLNKTLTQLEEERKARLAKVQKDGVLVNERSLEINKLYDKKIEDAKEEHAKKIEATYKSMYDNILAAQIQANERTLQNNKKQYKQEQANLEKSLADRASFENVASYGIQGSNRYSQSTQKQLGIVSNSDEKVVQDVKKLIELEQQVNIIDNRITQAKIHNDNVLLQAREQTVLAEQMYTEQIQQLEEKRSMFEDEEYIREYNRINNEYQQKVEYYQNLKAQSEAYLESLTDAYSKRSKILNEYKLNLQKEYTTVEQLQEETAVYTQLVEEGYSASLSDTYAQRISLIDAYWAERINITKQYVTDEYDYEKELRTEKYKEELDAENKRFNDVFKAASDWYDKRREQAIAENTKLETVEKEYEQIAEANLKSYQDKVKALTDAYNLDLEALENERLDKLKQENRQYYQDMLQELRDFQTSISNLESKQPVINAWNITNLKETNKNNRELLNAYSILIDDLKVKRQELNDSYNQGLIDRDVYESTIREMDRFVSDVGDKMDKAKYELSFAGQAETIIQDAQQYINTLGNHLTSMLSTIWNAADAEYDYQMELLDKAMDEYQQKLDEQQQMTQNYADAVNNIEDELKTARGDRRQQLIDNLNAQMMAQRASLAEEKRLEKEKQKLEQKKEREELAQRKKQHERDIVSAIISTALATANALATKPFVPVGLAMAGLAASMGAIQIGIISSQKYADGGVIDGKSHANGGVKVFGGRVELEGKEYITNKLTTQRNVELLDFINSKHRKLNLSDFVDFYSSKHVRNNIKAISPKNKFANGGVVPTLRTDIDMNDRLLKSFEKYAEKPTYVSVVEIENKMDDVRNVRALSGLE